MLLGGILAFPALYGLLELIALAGLGLSIVAVCLGRDLDWLGTPEDWGTRGSISSLSWDLA